MDTQAYDLHGVRIAALAAEGAPLRSDRDAVEAISATSPHRPEIIVIPAARLDEDFFRLKTGVAGQIVQKFVTYGFRLAILGDISSWLEQSSALRDFVYECNSGQHVWFVADLDELDRRLQRA